ncbi:MAG: murein L,D-transpeptidase catalytic domain family protein [Bacteroidetes bacterium]|nr:murein L,D-transpeptidase catalytic domain family protein [Bacteroidota bacterium]MBS1973454.1 murein L,D-transpeptidase catalytic domain family protein [Bacteroidota bacterium]
MKWLRFFLLSLLIIIFVAFVFAGGYYYEGFYRKERKAFITGINDPEISKVNEKALLLRAFAAKKKYNQKIAFLLDMSMPSGKYRFFVFDLDKHSIIKTALVAHGSGNSGFSLDAKFSNACESGYSSLGKYKIGKKYNGRFGITYKLYGLDSTNNNAFKRNIVLHAYDCVPENETYPYPICNSRGCPMVSPGFMKQLRQIIDNNRQPILLWVFN